MKTNQRVITTTHSRCYTFTAIVFLLLTGLFVNTAEAQRDKRGGDRNVAATQGSNKDNNARTPLPRGESRRPEVSINRSNPRTIPNPVKTNTGRDQHDQAATGNDRNFDRGGNNNSSGRDPVRNTTANNTDRNTIRGNNINESHPRVVNTDRPGLQNNNSNSNVRPGNNNQVRSENNSRPRLGTAERPSYRPVYGYDRRPRYNPHNPGWLYGWLPRRHSYFYSIPHNYFSISFGGCGYRYWDGVFYRPYNNLFMVIAPPIGIYIDVLPVGYRRIYVHDYPYYYFNGTYYDQKESKYYVVSPPVGAVVESLPEGYETVVIDGETYYTIDGAQYKPVIQQNGEIWYEVIKANKEK